MAAPTNNDNTNPWTTDPAQQQQQQSNQAAPAQSGGFSGFQQGMSPDDVRNQVQAYYQSRNVTPFGQRGSTPGSVDYWTQKWGEFGNNDPNYFMQRLSQADEFGGGGAGGSASGSNMSYTPWAADPRSSQLFNILMGQATQSQVINPNDPVIAAQTNAYGAQQTRGMRNYINQLAESEGPQANLGMEKRMGAEHAAQATGALQAQLMGHELDARRQQIQFALGQMGNQLSDEQKMALQKELAYLSNDQFLRELGLRAQQQAWSQDAASSGLT